MKILKRILAVIGILVLLVLIIALFVDRTYKVERSVVVNKPPAEVYNYVRYLKHGDQYNVWVMKDSAMKKDYRGEDGNVGFVYAWDSKKDAGKGEEEISNLVENKQVDVAIRFEKPMKNTASTTMTTVPEGSSATRLSWSMQSTTPYPLNFVNLFVPGILGKDIDKSLTNVKNILEKQ